MLRGIGPRFYVEAGFLILVAAVLAVQRVRWVEIVVVMLVAYVTVVSIELVLARRRVAAAKPPRVLPDAPPESEEDVPSTIVAVRAVEPAQPVAVPVEAEVKDEVKDEAPKTEWVDDPPRRPVAVSQPSSEPEAIVTELEPELEPELGPGPELEPIAEPEAPAVPPVLVAVPEPDIESEPQPQVTTPEPEPEPVPEPVVIASFPQQPRGWNLWELERLVRSRAGGDPVRDEEWGYLLVYLRDFASPEGALPEDFDALVRESFGDLLEAAAVR